MCLICIDIAKRAMNAKEARRALGEMREKLGPDHVAEVEAKVEQTEAIEAAEAAAAAQVLDDAEGEVDVDRSDAPK
jgi:hypothetical protein